MRLRFLALGVAVLVSRNAAAQLATSPAANPVGTWRGRSVCVARAAGCDNEDVVYHIARKGGHDSLAVDTRKLIAGREETTGLLACDLNASRGYFTCVVPTGKWRFRARHDSLIGQLRLRDGTWLLDVHAIRSREDQ